MLDGGTIILVLALTWVFREVKFQLTCLVKQHIVSEVKLSLLYGDVSIKQTSI